MFFIFKSVNNLEILVSLSNNLSSLLLTSSFNLSISFIFFLQIFLVLFLFQRNHDNHLRFVIKVVKSSSDFSNIYRLFHHLTYLNFFLFHFLFHLFLVLSIVLVFFISFNILNEKVFFDIFKKLTVCYDLVSKTLYLFIIDFGDLYSAEVSEGKLNLFSKNEVISITFCFSFFFW